MTSFPLLGNNNKKKIWYAHRTIITKHSIMSTEEGTILAITENGCVIDTPTITMPVIQECDGQPGDVVEVTYFVPAKATSGYFEKMQECAQLVQP